MARSFFAAMAQAARAAERAERGRMRAAQQQHRAMERAHREADRSARQSERDQRKVYLDGRAEDIEYQNDELAARIKELEGLLFQGLSKLSPPPLPSTNGTAVAAVGGWDGIMRRNGRLSPWALMIRGVDEGMLPPVLPPPKADEFRVQPLGLLRRLLPGALKRVEADLAAAARKLDAAKQAHDASRNRRIAALKVLQTEVDEHNRQIEMFRASYRAGDPEAVTAFFEIAMDHVEYPAGFPTTFRTAFLPASRQLIFDFDLPTLDAVIPAVERYRYTRSSDTVTESKRAPKARNALYASVVSQTVLRRLAEVFAADEDRVVDVVALNAFVDAIEPSTGQPVRPCLASVRTTRADFARLDLRHVDPPTCLKGLAATVSRSPAELAPVKPIIDIDMSDPRFIQEVDVLSTLDTRPNLMELTPGDFESLITNLFQKMGLETRLTQASRDGGVDCVAYDARPILGGKVIVQAKRYKNTVGVSAVRDLFGTMHNEGASKGILVTTSGYGSAAFEFAKGKPIELLDGSNLLYLLKEHGGIDARIIMPDDWRDSP